MFSARDTVPLVDGAPPCEPARSGSEGAGAATESGIGQTSWTQATDFGETGSRLGAVFAAEATREELPTPPRSYII